MQRNWETSTYSFSQSDSDRMNQDRETGIQARTPPGYTKAHQD